MKLIVLEIAALICINSALATRAQVLASLDTQGDLVVDAVITLLKKYAVSHTLEPMAIPDLTQNFTVDVLFVTFDGTLLLKNGQLSDLTTLERLGDASVTYEGNYAHIVTNITFNDLLLDYDYDVNVMGLNPTGTLKGTAKGLELTVDLTANLESYTTTLGGLTVTSAADISIEVDGNGIADDIANAISGIVEPFFEKDLLTFVEDKMNGTLADALVGFDFRDILNG